MGAVHRDCFSIVACGANFDVDGYLRRHAIVADEVWHWGELRPGGERLSDQNGFQLFLGAEDGPCVEDQQVIATEFLLNHEPALRELTDDPNVETFYLGIQEEVLMHSGGAIIDLSPTLMAAVLKVGVQLTLWAHLVPNPYHP